MICGRAGSFSTFARSRLMKIVQKQEDWNLFDFPRADQYAAMFREAQRFDMGKRIREVEQGPDGALWVLEDERNGSGGRLLKLTPQAPGKP